MKGNISYIIMFVGSLLVVTILALVAAKVKPELFMLGGIPPVPDSLAVAKGDSVTPGKSTIDSLNQKSQSHVASGVRPVQRQVVDSAGSVDRNPVSSVKAPLVPSDTSKEKEKKSLAKMFDTMEPQSAAKILGNLSDNEIKDVLLMLKKRQGAKILSELNPEQAARILKLTSQQ